MVTLQKPLYFKARMNYRKFTRKVGRRKSSIPFIELEPAIWKFIRTMIRWRETTTGPQLVTGLARNLTAGRRRICAAFVARASQFDGADIPASRRDSLNGPVGSGLDIIMAYDSRGRHLPLAARARVGHIGLSGAVAEWLKAAVC